MKTKLNTLLTLTAFSILGATSCFAANIITNGDFETGDFTGWTNSAQAASGGARTISTPGTATPLTSTTTPTNALGGAFYTVTDQSGPGSYSLVQTFNIPTVPTNVVFSFQMFNKTSAGMAINPGGLDYALSGNQHARVDILTAGANPFSTAPGDVLQNFYIGNDGANPGYTDYSFDVTSLLSTPGNYQIRFAQVDNQGVFQQGIDNVSINVIPEPSAALLGALGALGLLRRRR